MNLLPLTGQEKRLKELFLKNLDLQLDKPRYQPQFIEFPELREKIQQIIPSAFEEQFLELNCFETGQDVSVLTQMRYLPAVYHSHDFIEMLYAWHGECACYINGNELHLHNVDICLVAPGAVHAVAAVSDDAVIYIFQVRRSTFEQVFGTLLAEQSSLSDFLIKALYTDTRKNSVVFRTENVHDIRDCIARVYKEHNGENAHKKLMMNNLLESVLILLSRTPEFSAEIPVEQDVRADSKLVSILIHIHANYTRISI